MNSPLKVACLGAGYFSQFHTDGWNRNPRASLIACADTSLYKARQSSAQQAYSSLEEMLAECPPDILDIVTPPPTHLDAIKRAIDAKVGLIICQKPFCLSADEARQAIKLADDANITLVIHENFRFQPWYRCMKKAIESQLIGDVLQFTFRLRTGDGQGDDAYLDRQPYFRDMPRLLIHETAVHYVDTFRYLLGSADTVYADLRTLNPCIKGEDAGYVLFGYSDGRRAMFDGNRLLDHCTGNTRITLGEATLEGTKGEISLDGSGTVRLRKFGEMTHKILLETQEWSGFGGDCVYALQDHVVCALLDGTMLENRGADYLPVIDLVDAIYTSAEEGMRLKVE